MSSTPSKPWTTLPAHGGLVSITTHALHLSISGPPRTSHTDPLIIIFPGAGDISLSWTPVQRLLSPIFRVLLYDRSGLFLSERGPNRAIPTVAAEELHTALMNASLTPPYILVAHSYGAIIAREFLNLHPDSVAGMVLADPSTERQHLFFKIPDPDIISVFGSLNFARVTGLREDAKLTVEEWRERAKGIAKGNAVTQEEAAGFAEICETLGEKRQIEKRVLGTRPLSVIRCNGKRDFERMYKAGVEAGNGTEEERRRFRESLDGWEEKDRGLKDELLGLSGRSRMVVLEDCGHNVQLVRPDVVAGEVDWVVGLVGEGERDSDESLGRASL